MTSIPRVLVTCVIAALTIALPGCAERTPAQSIRAAFPADMGRNGPIMLAVYEAWFGQGDHLEVGYNSHDWNTLRKQVDQARSLGLYGFVVDWYGTKKPFIDESFNRLQKVAVEKDFKVALMYDEWVHDPTQMTADAISNLELAYKKYIGPDAPNRSAYMRIYGHPVIFIWPKGKHTDWRRVRQHVDSWPEPPILIYKDEPSEFADLFDGFYAWIHPGAQGWRPDGSNWGEQYLEQFYSRMSRERSDKIVVGAAWPGFDDSRAAWSENRYMDPKCGRTLDQTLNYFRRYYDPSRNPLPIMLIATWNDHEEGTAIERGIAKLKPTQRHRSSCEAANAD